MRRKIVAVIGNKKIDEDGVRYKLAYNTGKMLIDRGYRVQTGGLGGVMEAVLRGARDSEKYREGDTIAIVPSFDTETANRYADIVIPSGLDLMRNSIVANADAVIGVGGGAGTMSEYAFAWSMKRLVIAYKNSGGWSEKLAGTRLDDTVRYPDIPEDEVYSATSAKEAVDLIDKYVDRYLCRYTGIRR